MSYHLPPLPPRFQIAVLKRFLGTVLPLNALQLPHWFHAHPNTRPFRVHLLWRPNRRRLTKNDTGGDVELPLDSFPNLLVQRAELGQGPGAGSLAESTRNIGLVLVQVYGPRPQDQLPAGDRYPEPPWRRRFRPAEQRLHGVVYRGFLRQVRWIGWSSCYSSHLQRASRYTFPGDLYNKLSFL